jgi:hypothetical protein
MPPTILRTRHGTFSGAPKSVRGWFVGLQSRLERSRLT